MPNTASVNIYRWLGRANASNKQRTKPGVDTAGRINLVITHISEKVIASAFCEAISPSNETASSQKALLAVTSQTCG